MKIQELLIPDSLSSDYIAELPIRSLAGIKRINAFVGPNNSGKSRLLRELFATGPSLEIATDNSDSILARQSLRQVFVDVKQLHEDPTLATEVLNSLADLTPGFHTVTNPPVDPRKIIEDMRKLGQRVRGSSRYMLEKVRGPIRQMQEDLVQCANAWASFYNSFQPKGNPQQAPPLHFQKADFVYIPTLRGMRLGAAGDEANLVHAYFDRTYRDYFKGRWKSYSSQEESIESARKKLSGKAIFTGLDFYEVVTSKLLGTLADRKSIRDFEIFLTDAFFQGQPVALIPRRDSDTLHIKIGHERERPIQSLGDGLQQILIMTFPMFLNRDKPFFLFIEEPDLFLHPGYQRILIDAMANDPNPDLYVFVTTHSNQFLDITLSESSCAVFRCQKVAASEQSVEYDPKFRVSNTSQEKSELLEHLGVRPSSVLLANCTVWVEGVTDRLYLRRYLEIVTKAKGVRLVENLHFAFVEYGGGNITHWSFLDEEGMDVKRICAKLFLIADRDAKKETRHERLANELGERFYQLPVREIENLLAPAVISAVVREYEGDSCMLNAFNQSDYASVYLGTFIESHVLATVSKRISKEGRPYADKSGTVRDKVAFCQKALAHIHKADDMSLHAAELANKICDFILDENQM